MTAFFWIFYGINLHLCSEKMSLQRSNHMFWGHVLIIEKIVLKVKKAIFLGEPKEIRDSSLQIGRKFPTIITKEISHIL